LQHGGSGMVMVAAVVVVVDGRYKETCNILYVTVIYTVIII